MMSDPKSNAGIKPPSRAEIAAFVESTIN